MSDTSEWFQPDKSSPEYQVLEVLDKIGLSRELFTRYTGERARRIGDAILKAVAAELHPDKNRGQDVGHNGVDIREINYTRSLLASENLDLESYAINDNYLTLEVEDLKESVEFSHEQNVALGRVNKELFKSLIKAKEHEPVDPKIKGALLVIKQGDTLDNGSRNVDVIDQIIVTFDGKGLVKNIAKSYEKFEDIQRVLIKKIDTDAAQKIIDYFYSKNSNKKYELKSGIHNTDLMILGNELFAKTIGGDYESTGIVFNAETTEQKEYLDSVSNIPLGLTLARPKGQTDTDIKKKGDVVTPVFNYFETQDYVETDSKNKLVSMAKGAKFIGYVTVLSKGGDAKKDLSIRKSLKILPSAGGAEDNFKGVVCVDDTAMENIIGQSALFTTEIANLEMVKRSNTMYSSDHTLTIFYKKDSKGKDKFYLLPGAYTVIQPNKD